MKSILCLSVAFIFSLTSASAQVFHVGIKGGANINKLSGQSFKENFSYSYHAGAFAEIKISNKFYLQPEVIFNQISADTSSKFSQIYNVNATKFSQIKLNYLSIPILLNYNLSKNIALQAGPQYGILIDQNRNLLKNGQAAFKEGDFSLVGGLQLKFSSLRVYGRYAVGLNNINDIDNKDQWKSQSFQVGVGLAIF